jgi:hypothetical protein
MVYIKNIKQAFFRMLYGNNDKSTTIISPKIQTRNFPNPQLIFIAYVKMLSNCMCSEPLMVYTAERSTQ